MNNEFKESKFINYFRFRGLTQFPFVENTFDALNEYQLLSKIVGYLNEVITQQNIVTDNMNVLIKLYNELKSYVDTYFDNLDVQNEINNKLEKMVDDGTLELILMNYTNIEKTYNVYEDLINDRDSFILNQKLKTLGYYNISDGGSCSYLVEKENINTYQIYLKDDLYLTPIIDVYDIVKLGAKKDKSSDVSILINELIENFNDKNIYIQNGEYLINNTIFIRTGTKIIGENKLKTILYAGNQINIIENADDDITTCIIENLYFDGDKKGLCALKLSRNNPNLVWNDSRTSISKLCAKKFNDWCIQIGDPGTTSNVIELVMDDIYVHEYYKGGIYISRCTDSHFSNLRAGSGLGSTEPAILVEGYNIQMINCKGFLAGTKENPKSGIVFNGGANIVAEVEVQANPKCGVEIINTKDSIITIIADKNNLKYENDNPAILVDKIQNCIINTTISNNVVADEFETKTGIKIIEPKKSKINISCITLSNKIIDFSEYNINQIKTVSCELSLNGYNKLNISPDLPDTIPNIEGLLFTRINKNSFKVEGSVTADTNSFIIGSYGSNTPLTYLKENYNYEMITNSDNVRMSLYNYVSVLGSGINNVINGVKSPVTAIALTFLKDVVYDDIITININEYKNI